MVIWPRFGSWIALAALVAGCGGSDGSSGGFSGTYHAVSASGEANPAKHFTSFWGSASSNGFSVSLTTSRNTDTVVSGPGTETYDLDEADDGSILLVDPATSDDVFGGAVAAGGDMILAGSVRAGDFPRILALIRTSTGADLTTLSGAYHTAFFSVAGTGRTSIGSGTFDGMGTGAFPGGATVNLEGVIDIASLGTPIVYTVAADARATLSSPFSVVLEGGIDAGHEIAVLGGSSTSGGVSGFLVLMKKATAATSSTFSGDYVAVGMTHQYAVPAVRSFAGNLHADGMGTAGIQGTGNTEGAVGPTVADITSYTVGADGALSWVTDEGTLIGAVSASGRFVVAAGPIEGGTNPTLYLMARR